MIFYSILNKICCLSLVLLLAACQTTSMLSPLSERDKKTLDTHLKLGFEYIRIDNRDGARRHLQKAIELAPRSAPANNGLAVLYQLDGENELAESHFKKSIQYDRSFTQARYNYATFLYTQSRFQEAFDAFSVVVKDINYDRRAMALALLGELSEKLNRPEKARASYEHALNLDRTLPKALIGLANMNYDEGDYAKAKNYLEKYDRSVRQRTAKSLWLGIRLENKFGNKDKKASYIIALRNLYPYSNEYLLYKQSLVTEGVSQ